MHATSLAHHYQYQRKSSKLRKSSGDLPYYGSKNEPSTEIVHLIASLLKANSKISDLTQHANLISLKRSEALERLRSTNIQFLTLEDAWILKESFFKSEIASITTSNSSLQSEIDALELEKSNNFQSLDRSTEHISLFTQKIQELEILNENDKERASAIEILIKSQIDENERLNNCLAMLQIKVKEEKEIFNSDEAELNSKLKNVRRRREEALRKNEILRKKLEDIKDNKDIEDLPHPRVSFESRGESYKKLLEQWASQELQLKDLRSKSTQPQLSANKCNCDII